MKKLLALLCLVGLLLSLRLAVRAKRHTIPEKTIQVEESGEDQLVQDVERENKERVYSELVNEPFLIDEAVPYGDDPAMVYDVFYRDGSLNAPAVILVHGGNTGGSTQKSVHPIAEYYMELGFVAVAIDFRDDTPVEDMACSTAHFMKNAEMYGADPEALIMHGVSFGGNSAMIVYNEDEDWLTKCEIESAEFKFLAFVGHSANNLGHGRNDGAIHHIDAGDPPAHFIFGEDDPKFDISEPEDFMDRLARYGISSSIHVEPGVGHGAGDGQLENTAIKESILDFARSVTETD